MIKKICKDCGEDFLSPHNNKKFCSRVCYYKYRSKNYRGENHNQWKGGICSSKLNCKRCAKEFTGYKKTRKFCSNDCSHKWNVEKGLRKGKSNASWNGGEYIQIYKYLLKPKHPNSDSRGYIREHRFLMSEKIGRPLLKTEEVHHINGDKLDNRIENLELLTKEKHSLITCLTRPSRGSSKYKGVSWDKSRQKWQVAIVLDGKRLYAKRFESEVDASKYYQSLLLKHRPNLKLNQIISNL
jgi:hypothetical protein